MTLTYMGTAAPNAESTVVHRPRDWKADGTGKGILACHGHGGDATQYMNVPGNVGESLATLVDQGGYAAISASVGGTSWGDAAALTAIDNCYTYLSNGSFGSPKTRVGKVGIIGWSMGGLTMLNWIRANAAKVACAWLWTPLTDLQWADSKAGYVAPYSSFPASGSWQTEVNADYPGGFTASDPMAGAAAYRGLGIPIRICTASDDTVIPPAATDAFIAAVNDQLVTRRTPIPTGNHTGLFANVPPSEVLAFFKQYL